MTDFYIIDIFFSAGFSSDRIRSYYFPTFCHVSKLVAFRAPEHVIVTVAFIVISTIYVCVCVCVLMFRGCEDSGRKVPVI